MLINIFPIPIGNVTHLLLRSVRFPALLMQGQHLPADIVSLIASTLSVRDILMLSRTCHRYYNLLWMNEMFWGSLKGEQVIDALKYCARLGHTLAVAVFLRRDIRAGAKATAFTEAVKAGHTAICELLDSHVTNKTIRADSLMIAVKRGHAGIVRNFMKGAAVTHDLINVTGTAKQYDVLEVLLRHLPYKGHGMWDQELVCLACCYVAASGRVKLLQFLVDNGAEPWYLEEAAEHGHLDAVKYILPHIPDVSKRGRALRKAVRKGHREVVQLLAPLVTDIWRDHIRNDAESQQHPELFPLLDQRY